MEHDNKENSFLSAYWQDLNTRIDRDDSTPREKSDGYRKVLGFLNKLRSRKLINGHVYQKLSNSAHRKYTAVVDCMDDKEGMNNYASSVMELVSGLRNESNSWKSSLGEFESPTCQQFVSDIMEKTKASDAPCETISLKYKCRETQYAENADNIARGDERASLIEAQNNVTINTTKDSATSSPRVPRSMNQDIALPGQHMKISKPISNQPTVFAKRKFEEFSATKQKQSKPGEYSSSRTESLFSEKSVIHSNRPGEKPTNTGNETPETTATTTATTFLTAREQYIIDQRTKNRSTSDGRSIKQSDYGLTKKSLGTRRGTSSKFTPPVMNRQSNETASAATTTINRNIGSSSLKNGSNDASMDERLKNIDSRMIEMIENEIMDHGPAVSWSDIAGLEFAKNTIQEIVIWPMLRPDIFKGLRGPPKGLLLFGPPGTGKTLIGKCIASQSRATFFSISASSLTSKWIGDGEKMVRALFGVARCQESAVIFIDEIDSLLSQRSDGEHEATRRIKTEFLVQLDGATTKAEERILVVGATNRPQELDEAARRRLVKRLYIPLPDAEARRQIVVNLMQEQRCSLDKNDLDMIMESSDGYSGADMANLCREAALGPIRSISRDNIQFIKSDEVRPIIYKDFEDAFKNIRPSVSLKDLELYTQWNKQYGSGVGI